MERVALGALEHTVEREFEFTGGAVVRVGRTADGWFCWHSRRGEAFVFVHERAMTDLADKWLARGTWREVSPATPER